MTTEVVNQKMSRGHQLLSWMWESIGLPFRYTCRALTVQDLLRFFLYI